MQLLSRHSHVSKRSSLASNNNAVVTTTAEVAVMSVSPRHQPTIITGGIDLERRISRLSDTEVEKVASAAMEEVISRRNSQRSSRSVNAMVAAANALPIVPPTGAGPGVGGPGGAGLLLAPPTEAEQAAQRRFSEVNAAIERHNSRRQAKRSQSVMHRNKRRGTGTTRRGSEIRRLSPGAEVFDPYNRMSGAGGGGGGITTAGGAM